MFKKIIFACLVFISCQAFAQLTALPKLPVVTTQDLQEKFFPKDSSAVAAVQYKYGNTWFDIVDNWWVMNTEVVTRIKIYKKEGYEWANFKKEYYADHKLIKLTVNEGTTYNLSGNTIEKTLLKPEGIFEDAPFENWKRTSIKLPNVKEGSIVEFKYTVRTLHSTPDDFYFQHTIPVNHAKYDVAIPSYFYHNVFTLGHADIKNIEPHLRDNNVLAGKMDRNQPVMERVFSYYADDVKAIGDEPFVNNIDNYTGTIKHELAAKALPFKAAENYAVNWQTVAKTIYNRDNFGRELKQTSYFQDDLKVLLAGTTNNTEKMTAIFNYVKSRMNWNGDKRLYCKDGVKKAYEAKVGNSAEINLMLTAMLREAGLNANPVLVSTRDNGIAVYPTVFAYNYVICAVKEGEKDILLDATSKYTVPGILPIRAVNWEGRMIKKNGDNEEINLMPTIFSKEITNIAGQINADGSVTGKVRSQKIDYEAYLWRENYTGLNTDSYLEKLEKKYTGIRISDYKVSNDKEIIKPLLEEYSFSHSALADIIGSKIYINPMLFCAVTINPFKQEKREFPIDFIFPFHEKYVVSLRLPDGYTVESIPQPVKLSMEENIGTFTYDIQQNGPVIQMAATIQVNMSVVSKDYYTTIKDFFQKMIEKQNEKIVLKKS